MNSKSEISNAKSNAGDIINWGCGIIVFMIGLLNVFWGNDPGFGVFLLLLSFIYFPPVNTVVRNRLGFSIPVPVKIILGVLILWAALGVGELFDKLDLMIGSAR